MAEGSQASKRAFCGTDRREDSSGRRSASARVAGQRSAEVASPSTADQVPASAKVPATFARTPRAAPDYGNTNCTIGTESVVLMPVVALTFERSHTYCALGRHTSGPMKILRAAEVSMPIGLVPDGGTV